MFKKNKKKGEKSQYPTNDAPPPYAPGSAMNYNAPPNYYPGGPQQYPNNPTISNIQQYPQYPQHPQYPPGYTQVPGPYYQRNQTNTTVIVQGAYDSGARFDCVPASIPPPPPGVAPNAAQLAAMQGHNVVATQRHNNFWSGDGTTECTWW